MMCPFLAESPWDDDPVECTQKCALYCAMEGLCSFKVIAIELFKKNEREAQ